MVLIEYFNEYILDLIFSKISFLNNFYIIIILLGMSVIYTWYYNEKLLNWIKLHHAILTIFIVIICLCSSFLLISEKYYFPKPSQDQFIVAISPISVGNSEKFEGDFDTAKELKEKIESSTDDRIKAIVLDSPSIINDKDAIYRGKKAGASIVIYGEQKKKLGDIIEIEFHIVPINFEILSAQSNISYINDKEKFKCKFSPQTADTVLIVDSLTENVSSTVSLMYALEHYNKSEYKPAIKEFRSTQDYENKDTTLYYIANCHLEQGEFNNSLIYFEKALEINPKNSNAWHGKGLALGYLGKYEEALTSFNKSIEINSNDYVVWNNKGYALYNLGKYEEALQAYNKSIELNSNFTLAWINKGNAFDSLGRHKEAIQTYDKVIEIDPKNSIALSDKGNSLINLGEYEEAIKAYDKAIKIDPKNSNAWHGKGLALGYLGKYEEALTSFNKSIEINSNDYVVWNNKGYALYNLGKYEEALQAYNKSIELNSNFTLAWINKGNAFDSLGRHKEAIQTYNECL